MGRKKAYTGLFVMLFIYVAIIASIAKGNNSTLEKVIGSMSPNLDSIAIDATYVRTFYEKQSLDTSSQNPEPKIKRTIINEILTNSNGIKESLCDSRLVGSLMAKKILSKDIELVKQSAFYYSDD